MRFFKGKQMACICEQNAAAFQAKMNVELARLNCAGATYEIQYLATPFMAYITYECQTKIAETVEDEYILNGERHNCGECKYFELPNDKRVKNVHCKLNGNLRQSGSCACEAFYEAISKAETFFKAV